MRRHRMAPVTEHRMAPVTEWKPEGNLRAVPQVVEEDFDGPWAQVQYLRGPGHVGAHQLTVYEAGSDEPGKLLVLPDPTTSARKRSECVSVALGENHSGLAAIIGELVLAGATNLLLDGRPLFPRSGAGRWVVELVEDGEVTMRYLEGRSLEDADQSG